MLITLFITCCIVCGLQLYQVFGHFTLVAPGTFRSNSDYHVSLSLDDFPHPCWFNVTLGNTNNLYEPFSRTTVEIEPNTTKLVKIKLPKLYQGFGYLNVIGHGGIIFRERAQINIEERQYSVYIQTDKNRYKPGEMVQFRVIFIDRLMRPAEIDEVVDVNIYDGRKNFIRKFSNLMLLQGVFKGDLQLSDHVVLGEWVIEVRVGGFIFEKNVFEVARYVLPMFSVEINTKEDVAVNEDKLIITVKSSYTYGQPVFGNLTINLKSSHANISMEREFDGETTIGFSLETDLNITKNSFQEHNRKFSKHTVEAKVTEALTGRFYTTTTEVRVHSQPYKIKVDAPKVFDPGYFINIRVSVTDLQGNPIIDSTNPIKITVKPDSFFINAPEEESYTYLNEYGVGEVTLKLPNVDISEYEASANYLGCDSGPSRMQRRYVGDLNLKVLTERPEVGKELLIKLTSRDPIYYFIYDIVSRGDIIQSQRINLPAKQTTFLLRLNTTYAMVPKITLFVHRINNGVLNSRLKEVHIKERFQNSINIKTEKEVHPGALVSLSVTTDENSYVGLMGIDERLLIQADYKTSLTVDNIYTKLGDYDSFNIDDQEYPGYEAGLITFSNGISRICGTFGDSSPRVDVSGVISGWGKPDVDKPRIRKLFVDSWMFKDFERTPKGGLKLNEVIPDTITSWAITGFSLNPNTGLTLTKSATMLKVFQEFFISMDMPNMVKEGEIIEIPVYIFNYLDQDLLANVTVKSFNEDLEILASLSSDSIAQQNQTYVKSISRNAKEKFVFLIRPRKSGHYNVTVEAISPIASDAVEKTLFVESDGTPFSISKTYLVHLLKDSQEREDDILVEIPDNSIPNSESVYLTVVGDIFAPLMRSIEKLVRVPHGNSESTMKYFVSNLLVLKYLKTMNHSNPSLEKKAKLYLELGYQTQLTFKHLDGSFSLFDSTFETTGDTRITAYTMWALQQAKNFIQIGSQTIKRGLGYLKSQQTDIGGFNSGKTVDEDVALTALSILAFLVDDKNKKQYQDVISKGLQYLYDVLDDLEHPTTKAISTYALVLGKHDKSEELLAKLNTQAALKCKQIQWTKPDTLQSNIATTAFTLMSLLESQETFVETLYPILRSLIDVKENKETPAYMLALEAMIKFAQHIHFNTTACSIHFEDDQGESGDIIVNSTNAQILQEVQLKSSSRHIKLRTKGKGFSLITINYKYNIVPENQSSSNYQTNVTIKEPSDRVLVLNVCLSKQPNGNQSYLTVIEINFPSGHVVYEYGFEEIRKKNERVKSIELMESGQSVRVYLENISQNGTCIQLESIKTIRVFNSKPVAVVVYDMEAAYNLF